MKNLLLASVLFVTAGAAVAEPVDYVIDSGHSQILFSYEHLGFSTTYGMFSGFEGTIEFDADDPANSAVSVSFPASSMLTGWEQRLQHFMSADFFNAAEDDRVSFVSTGIEVTGEDAANITGDLTMNGTTKSVVLLTTLNASGKHPMAGKEWLGFDASATVLRSDFGLGAYAPAVSDEVEIMISIEAGVAKEDAS
ncbi:MAG: YceI family protein [Pseudoruegeria sp.]